MEPAAMPTEKGRVLPILRFEQRIRFKPCAPVSVFGENQWASEVARNLAATCEAMSGYGIAAPQVGIFYQICLVNTKTEQLILVNPHIVHSEGKQENLEGCLSLPGCAGRVQRPMEILIMSRLLKDGAIGEEVSIAAEGMEASVFQHELDHLQGEFFVDRMSSVRRDIMLRKIAKSWGRRPRSLRERRRR